MDLIDKMKICLDYESLINFRQKMTAERKVIFDDKSDEESIMFGRASDLNFFIERVENRIKYLESEGHYFKSNQPKK